MTGTQLTPRLAVVHVAPTVWAVVYNGKTLTTTATKEVALEVASVLRKNQ